jgi:hypothetical protein
MIADHAAGVGGDLGLLDVEVDEPQRWRASFRCGTARPSVEHRHQRRVALQLRILVGQVPFTA